MRALVLAAACAAVLAARPARADEDPMVAEARAHFEKKEFVEARALLLDAYKKNPDRDILYALGQVELVGLGDAAAAIPYYERYIATNPPQAKAAAAQEAIGVARGMLLAAKAKQPRRVTRRRPWDLEGTGLVALGGAAIVAGGALFYYGRRISNDGSGTLSKYDARLHQARRSQWIGAGAGAAGAVLVAAALVRWRISTETVEIRPTPSGATVSLGGHW